jgi:hypothetical protein
LNITVEEVVNPTPLIVIESPATPPAGETPVMDNVGVKLVVLVAVPAAVVTEIAPALVPSGTVAVISVGDTTVKLAGRVPNLTLLAPLKLVPVSVTGLPLISEAGVNDVIVGATLGVTVNDPELVAVPADGDVLVTLS